MVWKALGVKPWHLQAIFKTKQNKVHPTISNFSRHDLKIHLKFK